MIRKQCICAIAIATLAATSCGDAVPNDCERANAQLGMTVCLHNVDEESWRNLAVEVAAIDQVRATKYIVPATSDARVPTLIIDAHTFDTHFQFLVQAFGDRFPGLSLAEYAQLITDASRRELYAGSLTEYRTDGGSHYGFVVWDDQRGVNTAVSCSQFEYVHRELSKHVGLSPLSVVPTTPYQTEVLQDCTVPWFDANAAVNYEAYSRGIGYGTLRRYTLAELEQATQRDDFGFQDIIVVDSAPLDIETVISGSITGTRQGELSHLNVRAVARGTPNCYQRNAYELTAQWDNKLVRVDCAGNGLTITETTVVEAQAWWNQLKPTPVDVPEADTEWTLLPTLLETATTTAADRNVALQRYGAKGSNLASLYQRVDSARQLAGFLVPFSYYTQFMSDNHWTVDLGDGPQQRSFADTIAHYLQDPTFAADGAVRRQRLLEFQTAMETAPCADRVVAALVQRIDAVFGSTDVMVRFRSSSNAEDSASFSGAGLYESTSVCAADDADADDVGPSRCDADKANERGVCRGLTRVWSSLWAPKAFSERAWFGIDHSKVAMAVLVNARSKREQANIVAFTGDPGRGGDSRYLVNAQLGELAVVSARPGVWPEKTLLTMTNGQVTGIDRARESSETQPGDVVLADEQLKILGSELAIVATVYPFDHAVPSGRDLLFDTEWKILEDGRLIIKQIRPFLR